jgi:hypothetical protein
MMTSALTVWNWTLMIRWIVGLCKLAEMSDALNSLRPRDRGRGDAEFKSRPFDEPFNKLWL